VASDWLDLLSQPLFLTMLAPKSRFSSFGIATQLAMPAKYSLGRIRVTGLRGAVTFRGCYFHEAYKDHFADNNRACCRSGRNLRDYVATQYSCNDS
jgi:hypothetical protein